MASWSAALSGLNGAELGQVDSHQVPAEVPGQRAFHPGLVQRAEADEVRRVHQVDGVAHQVSAKHGPFGHQVLQVLMTEAGQPRPQPDVRGQRGLGLQAGQVADRIEGRQRSPVEQQLARQRGAVQCPQVQAVRAHPRAAAV
jgi:hypothetical protein